MWKLELNVATMSSIDSFSPSDFMVDNLARTRSALVRAATAVSYTHLDVYKRQVPGRGDPIEALLQLLD